jgi:hypothetical protein
MLIQVADGGLTIPIFWVTVTSVTTYLYRILTILRGTLYSKEEKMSLENAREILKEKQMTQWGFERDMREILMAHILVELIEEVRFMRNDLYKLLQNK